MSIDPRYTRIEVAAATGQLLSLSHNARHDEYTLSVYPRRRSRGVKGNRIAFMLGDEHERPRLTPPNMRYGETHHTLWVGRACVDVTEATANTIEAWINSRPGPGATGTTAASELPADIATPAAVERAA